MRTSLRSAAALALFAALTTGCATRSPRPDLARVQELTHTAPPPNVASDEVEPTTPAEIRRLTEQPLDADAAVRIALANNRELRATMREMGIARGRLVQAGLLPNPIVEAEFLPERQTQVALRVEYDITSALLAKKRANAAAPDLEAARYRAAGAVVDVGYEVRRAFFALQAADQRSAIAQRVLDAFAAGRDAARALVLAGNVRELDLATQEAAYEQARVTVTELELDVLDARERLNRLLGFHGKETAWSVRGPLPPPGDAPVLPDAGEAKALRASFELGEARSMLEGSARRAGFARTSGWLPDVAADVHVLYGDPDRPGQPRDPRVGAGVKMTVPVFDRLQGTTRAYEAEFDAGLERYHGLAIDIRSALREAQNHVESAHARARHYERAILPARKRVLEQSLLQYNAMQIGVFQLLQARRDELDAELAYVETLREYWSASAGLQAILAGKRVATDDRRRRRALSPSPTGGL
jgi:outer membrane protein, heavy metal efflux system